LPLAFILSAYLIADWMDYGLAAPPPDYEWVRYGPDILLVDPNTGQIVDGAYSAFTDSDDTDAAGYGQGPPSYQAPPGYAGQPPGYAGQPPGYAGQPPPAMGPQTLGTFGNWVAAAYQENGQPVCYASTRAVTSMPPVPNRGAPVLTVTERASGRDAVSLGGILADGSTAGTTVYVDGAPLGFYAAAGTAYASDGASAAAAFRNGNQAVVQSMSPYNGPVTDTFSLIGFSASYAAINAACPMQ
jgi:hypothetical protein